METPGQAGHQESAIGAEHRLLYRILAGTPGLSTTDLSEAAGLSQVAARHLLEDLAGVGLALEENSKWWARRPQDRLDAALASQVERLQQFREENARVQEFIDIFAQARTHEQYSSMELLEGGAALVDYLSPLLRNAKRSVRAFDRAPHYSSGAPELVEKQLSDESSRIDEGVHYRVIYDLTVWEDPVHASSTLASIRAGEEARIVRHLPLKLYLFDDDVAILVLDPRGHEDGSAMLVKPSGLLRALSDVFETFWEMAAPLAERSFGDQVAPTLAERERDVLVMLAGGASDAKVVRQLGISRSTLTRTLSDLAAKAGVATRFQLAAEAVRRGWI